MLFRLLVSQSTQKANGSRLSIISLIKPYLCLHQLQQTSSKTSIQRFSKTVFIYFHSTENILSLRHQPPTESTELALLAGYRPIWIHGNAFSIEASRLSKVILDILLLSPNVIPTELPCSIVVARGWAIRSSAISIQMRDIEGKMIAIRV